MFSRSDRFLIFVLLIMILIMATVSVDANSTEKVAVDDPADVAARTTTLFASANCIGPNLEVTITAGDGPFSLLAESMPTSNSPLVEVPSGTYIFPGPGTWVNIRVAEHGGYGEISVLGDFTCTVAMDTSVPQLLTATTTDTPPTGSVTPLPDLLVQMVRIELENGSNCASGLGTSVWIHNEGDADAGPFDVLVNSTTLLVAGLGAGQTVYLWTSDYNYLSPETEVVADSNNDVAESDESNNTFFQLVPIPTLPQHCLWTDTPTGSVTSLPDLLVQMVRIELENGSNCASGLGTSVWIHNQGNADAGPFDVLVNGGSVVPATVSAPGVTAGQSVYVWAPTILYPGTTTVDADSNDDVVESNETNNSFSGFVPIPTLPPHCLETDTPMPPTDTPFDTVPLVASAACINENLVVTVSAGDGPFDITANAGINIPVNGVNVGTTVIPGPEKWDNLTVTETTGDSQSVNLGQFKCRTDERPVPVSPTHRSRTTNPYPSFSWAGITGANNYRVFIFDDRLAVNRTVDIRQNSGGPTTMALSTPLPDGRLFWRVRGRQNRVWSLWSVRFTLFKDPAVP